MKPRSFPAGTPKTHFFRIELDVICSEIVERKPHVIYYRLDVSGFDDYVVYVCLHCFADLCFQACLNHALIVAPAFLSPKGMVLKQKGPYGVMNAVAA